MQHPTLPAFPVHNTLFNGLTKREYFAAMAMQGLMSACTGFDGRKDFTTHLTCTAVVYADALIAALNEPQTTKQ